MYSEIGFIFNPALSTFGNIDNTGNIYQRPIVIQPSTPNQNTSQGQSTPTNNTTGQNPSPTSTRPAGDNGILVYKDPKATGTVGIMNYIKENVYKYDDSNGDPYIALMQYFGDTKTKALKLRAADFAYLKDLGVYPTNRLWILRRFPDNCIVPNNLTGWGTAVEPISTVIGWIKDQDTTPLLTVSFNEVWTDQNQMIDKVLTEILNDNFGLKLPATVSVPGWSQGLLFGMLNAMGLTNDYNAMNVPTGDPNVLRVGKMREVNNQGLLSKINMTLETCYEQKYINGIDPGLAMMDVLSNLFKMGTSDQRFILSNSPMLQKLIGNINGNKNINAWLDFIKSLVKSFLNGVTTFIKSMTTESSSLTSASTFESGSGNTNQQTNPPAQDKSKVSASATVNNLANSLLAGTIAKYRWPLKGSIALMSGINTTPWHLTIGNPYSPIINIGNIYVSNVEVKLSNDLGFNDMPARIDVTVSAEFGRPLGKQELEKMFNNGYKRIYSSKDPAVVDDSKEVNSNIPASQIPAPVAVYYNPLTQQQPSTNTDQYINPSGSNNTPYPGRTGKG